MMSSRKDVPPRLATRFLQWYCAPHLLEEIQGDLEEEFYHQVEHKGLQFARRDYVRSVLGFIKPFAIKRKSSSTPSPLFTMRMFKHHIVVALRNIARHKSFAAINTIGLALGMTCCLSIFLWVRCELATDHFHKDNDHLYTVYMSAKSNAGIFGAYNTPRTYDNKRSYVLLDNVKQSIPEIKEMSFYATGYSLPWGHPETFQYGEKVYKFEGSRASSDFFTMFNYPVIAGNGRFALNDISSIAISRKMANLFFDTPQKAIGKSIRFENYLDLNVAAVFEDVPDESSLKFDYVINWEAQMTKVNWASHIVNTYMRVADGADVKAVEAKLNKYIQPRLDKNPPAELSLGLQPYRDQYLRANFENGKPAGGRIEYLKLFSWVAVFIIVIACINFMNLATARSVKRAKEVGVRKVIGSSRTGLMAQFFGESILLAVFALVLSIILLLITLPFLSDITGKHLTSPFVDLSVWLWLALFTLGVGIFAGSYPALFLSSLKPVRVLKGLVQFTRSAILFRKSLTIFQFGLSVILLVGALVVWKQTNYMQNVNLGYNKENLVYFTMEGDLIKYEKYKLFKDEALKIPGVTMVDRSTEAPHSMGFTVDEDEGNAETADPNDYAIKWEGKEKGTPVGFKPASVGFDFIKLMDLKVVEGRSFSKDNATDSADAFMINEEAVKEMHLKDPIGKWVSAWSKKGHIIGVLKNYNSNSLHEKIKPLIIDVKEYENFGMVLIRIDGSNTKETLVSLGAVYKKVNPNYPIDVKFVDVETDKMYRNEQFMSKLSGIFSIVAIVISCLGLLGLVMFSSEQRVKEIGIRKVLGATVSHIITLMSKDLLQLVVLAFVIGVPVAAMLMNNWLQTFAYKITIAWWMYAIAGFLIFTIALVTICLQTFKSAVANPVKALKTE